MLIVTGKKKYLRSRERLNELILRTPITGQHSFQNVIPKSLNIFIIYKRWNPIWCFCRKKNNYLCRINNQNN